MKITSVDAFSLRAPSPSAQTYWGSQAWAQAAAGAKTPEVSDIEEPAAPWEEYPGRWRMRASYSGTINTVIVRVTTDDGLVGYGEAKAPVAPEVTREIVRDVLAPVVVGLDPLDIDVLWERMYSTMRLRGHQTGFLPEALSGVDIALGTRRQSARCAGLQTPRRVVSRSYQGLRVGAAWSETWTRRRGCS